MGKAADEPACEVGGVLELDFGQQEVVWQLYNKHPKPAQLKSIEASWPESLGLATSAQFGDRQLALSRTGIKPGKLNVEIPEKQVITIRDTARLRVTFDGTAAQGNSLEQRDFKIKASFHGDCSAETIPGYADNQSDFYYSTVTGADNLHRHDIRGQGVTVAVLDSGLWEHEHLARNTQGKKRILARFDAITGNTVDDAFDESGHGTHLTSVLGAAMILQGYRTRQQPGGCESLQCRRPGRDAGHRARRAVGSGQRGEVRHQGTQPVFCLTTTLALLAGSHQPGGHAGLG